MEGVEAGDSGGRTCQDAKNLEKLAEITGCRGMGRGETMDLLDGKRIICYNIS